MNITLPIGFSIELVIGRMHKDRKDSQVNLVCGNALL